MENYPDSGEQADVYSWGKYSAAPTAEREKSSHQHPIQTILPDVETDVATDAASVGNKQRGGAKAERCKSDRFNRAEAQLPKNIDGSDRLPWETEILHHSQ